MNKYAALFFLAYLALCLEECFYIDWNKEQIHGQRNGIYYELKDYKNE